MNPSNTPEFWSGEEGMKFKSIAIIVGITVLSDVMAKATLGFVLVVEVEEKVPLAGFSLLSFRLQTGTTYPLSTEPQACNIFRGPQKYLILLTS